MSTNVPSSTPADAGGPRPVPGSGPQRGWPWVCLVLALGLVASLLLRSFPGGASKGGARPIAAAPLNPAQTILDVGDRAPDFTLKDAHGDSPSVTLSDITRKKSVLLIYYLGYACPRCVTNLRALEDRKEELDKIGIQILAVSPNTVTETNDSIGLYGDFPFPLLADTDGKVAAAYRLKFGEELLHGCYLIDRDGRIRFAMRSSHPYDNYDELLALCRMVQDNP